MRKALLFAVVVLGLLPSAATAARPATAEEVGAMGASLRDLARDPQCATGSISTVDPTWGVLWRTSLDCREHEGLAALVQLRGDGRWLWALEAELLDRTVACEEIPLDAAIGRDLDVCRPASGARFLACTDRRGRPLLRRRPASCAVMRDSIAASRLFEAIRWSRWGGRESRGRGWLRPNHPAGPSDRGRPVTLIAGALAYCGAAKPYYLTLAVRGKPYRQTLRTASGRTVTRTLPGFSELVMLKRPPDCGLRQG